MGFSTGRAVCAVFLHNLWLVKVFPWGCLSQRSLLIFPERCQTLLYCMLVSHKKLVERNMFPTHTGSATPTSCQIKRFSCQVGSNWHRRKWKSLPLNFFLNSGWTLLVWMGDTKQSFFAQERWSVMTTSRLTEHLAVLVALSWLR